MKWNWFERKTEDLKTLEKKYKSLSTVLKNKITTAVVNLLTETNPEDFQNSYIELLTIACNVAEFYQFKSPQINKIILHEMCYYIYRINKDYPAWNLKGTFPNMKFISSNLNGNLDAVYRSLQ